MYLYTITCSGRLHSATVDIYQGRDAECAICGTVYADEGDA
jgi:hypothetical protein